MKRKNEWDLIFYVSPTQTSIPIYILLFLLGYIVLVGI